MMKKLDIIISNKNKKKPKTQKQIFEKPKSYKNINNSSYKKKNNIYK